MISKGLIEQRRRQDAVSSPADTLNKTFKSQEMAPQPARHEWSARISKHQAKQLTESAVGWYNYSVMRWYSPTWQLGTLQELFFRQHRSCSCKHSGFRRLMILPPNYKVYTLNLSWLKKMSFEAKQKLQNYEKRPPALSTELALTGKTLSQILHSHNYKEKTRIKFHSYSLFESYPQTVFLSRMWETRTILVHQLNSRSSDPGFGY